MPTLGMLSFLCAVILCVGGQLSLWHFISISPKLAIFKASNKLFLVVGIVCIILVK